MSVYGLVDDSKKRVPLKRIDVKALIQGFIASVETKLVYENSSENPIEATFTFPIDGNSAVYKFEVLIGGKLIVGECQDKNQARQTYNDAIAAGDSAFLMEEKGDSGDIFECTVGNLPAKTEATVTFTYVTQCHVTGNMVEFVYPCVLAPRYTPDAATSASQASSTNQASSTSRARALKWSSVPVGELPYKATAVVYVRCSEPQSIENVELNMALEKKSSFFEDQKAKVTLSKGMKLDQDLRVDITYKDLFKPVCYTELGDPERSGMLANDIMMVQFKPDLDRGLETQDTRGEYIFVLDRSGSMGGDRIKNATKSLLKCLELLPKDCYFNIVSFGTHLEILFSRKTGPCGVKMSDNNLKTAVLKVNKMDADLGGTEMEKPFEWIYSRSCIPDYPRQVILLTDGAYYPLDKFAKLVKANNGNTRVFTMGIGFGASTALIRTLAREGRGRCEFMREDMHKLQKQVEMLLSCAMSPSMMDVGIKWECTPPCRGSLIPKELPPVFTGQTLVAYILATAQPAPRTKAKAKQMKVTLSGVLNRKDVTLTSDFKENLFVDDFEADLPIHRMAAKAYIKELEGDEEYRGQNQNSILLVSLSANIMSRYTSFVAVYKRSAADKVKDKADHVDIPVAERQQSSSVQQFNVSRQYGGGSCNSSQLFKYLNGKTADIPAAPQAANKTESRSQETFLDTWSESSSSDGSDMSSPEAEKAAPKTGENKCKPRNLKRKGNVSKFTVRKRRKILECVARSVFAPGKDGYYYPGVAIETKGNHHKLRFKDNQTKVYNTNQLLEASKLSPIDVVSVHAGKQHYVWAMVLEYTAEQDAYRVATGDGRIVLCLVQDLVLPHATGQVLAARCSHDPEPQVLVKHCNSAGSTVAVSTSDLAELGDQGWINANIVSFYIREMLLKNIPETIQQQVLVFDNDVTQLLADDIYTQRKNSKSRWNHVNIEAVRASVEDVDFRQKKMIFFPLFDEVHWYVIVVAMETVPFEKDKFRGTFLTMDSYFEAKRELETSFLKSLLVRLFNEQGLKLDITPGAKSLDVPAQRNEWDCGLYMLLNIRTALQEKLLPRPHLEWFSPGDALKLRQDIARHILDCSDIQ